MSSLVGKPAPNFSIDSVLDGQFSTATLDQYKGKWLVVVFYPLDFTFVCPTELLAYSDRIEEFRKIGAEIVGVSVDSKYTHLAWTEKSRKSGGIEGLAYPLLADLTKKMAADYQVLTEDGVALRGLFIIDPSGVVQHATVNNLGVGRDVDETLRVLQAFQFVAENGEVCPAGWHPGERTMKADPKGSLEFFAGQN